MFELIDLNKEEYIIDKTGTEIIGLYVLRGNENITSKIRFKHTVRDVHSRITVKFILLDESSIDINATVEIDRGAKATNTYLKLETLILSEKARANVIPSMEIKENEVKGGHGATIGMLDQNMIWYLKSRGIPEKTAYKMIIEGFVLDLIDKVDDDNIKQTLQDELKKLKL